ncbi:hypothetical protein [Desulforhopalus singaporensis]|uniref:hypothetical protein n=1 Tax=Desulforhopalus singaporensis TaxID=91360 RepID=UPI0038B3F89D
MILKNKLTLSHEETAMQIQGNPYIQYFVGFSSYVDKPVRRYSRTDGCKSVCPI